MASVSATINGDAVEFLCEPRQTLLEVLRDTLGMTGTKEGCSNGNCGACTVLVNGRPVVSCLVFAVEAVPELLLEFLLVRDLRLTRGGRVAGTAPEPLSQPVEQSRSGTGRRGVLRS